LQLFIPVAHLTKKKSVPTLKKPQRILKKASAKALKSNLKVRFRSTQVESRHIRGWVRPTSILAMPGALSAYLKIAELDPDNTEARLKLATFYLLGKKYDETREKIDAVLAKEPNNIEALLLLSGLLVREKNLSKATSVLNKVIDQDSRETRAYLGLSRALAVQDEFNDALKTLNQAVNIDPKVLKPRLALFTLYFKL